MEASGAWHEFDVQLLKQVALAWTGAFAMLGGQWKATSEHLARCAPA